MSDSPLGNFLELGDVLAWLNLDGSEVEEQVAVAVDAANDAVLEALGWDPRNQTVTELCDGSGGIAQPVERPFITAVASISVQDQDCGSTIFAPIDMTSVTFHPKLALIYSPNGFAFGSANVQVQYTAGYSQVPGGILMAVRYTIRAMLDAADANMNATGEAISGVLSQSWNPGGPGVVPPSALRLIDRYVRKF